MDPNRFVLAEPRPLPVVVLIDTSGSMKGQKIDSLNAALREMVSGLRSLKDTRGEIHLAIIGFGNNQVTTHHRLSPLNRVSIRPFEANGSTPLGAAMVAARELIEDREAIPSRAYTPTAVLVSDGMPTDITPEMVSKLQQSGLTSEDYLNWEPISSFHLSERCSKCVRLAIGIGQDADHEMLRAWVNSPGVPIASPHDADGIQRFFRWVTMSVSVRSMSSNPNVADLPPIEGYLGRDEWVL